MSDSEKALAKYVEKMYEIQYAQKDNILSDSELKKIALDMGISEEEWQASEQVFEGSLENGKELILQQNYADAADTLDHAISLKPYHPEALYMAAKANVGLYEFNKTASALSNAKELIDRTLKVQPGHKQALSLLTKLRREQSEGKKTSLYILVAIIVAVLLAGGIGFTSYTSAKNKAIVQEESVNQAWAQVENVYQRRADLIPQLVEVVKKSEAFEKGMIDKVTEAYKSIGTVQVSNLTEADLAAFQSKQLELSVALKKLFGATQNYPDLETMELYKNLQVQIEGSENRISVERRKFNQAVQAYNTYIRQFPQSMMGLEAKPYFEVDKKAMEVPSLK